ncbi:MAG: isoaspartyl peptidase/L-asparaginase [Bacillota bacterium]
MAKRIILATWRFGEKAVRAGWPYLGEAGGALDAVEQGCRAVESDPEVDSVGLSGKPDAEGRVTLDASIMLSPAKSAGVACVSGQEHPVSLARRVMEETRHRLIVGTGTERQGSGVSGQGSEGEGGAHDTVGVLAMDVGGVMAGACSTSGLAGKLPGRVGDSPIIGHGLYVDPRAGAATTTGVGELMMGVCASFLAVEKLRMGATPGEAVRAVLERIVESYVLREEDQCGIIVMRPDGEWACGALREGFVVAVKEEEGERVVEGAVRGK